MATLKTDYKDDVFSGNRKYNMITNEDGTVSFVDVTEYTQEGDSFNAAAVNGINTEVNKALKSDTAVTVAQGGTGATTAAGARSNLGLGNAATKGVDATPTDGSTNLVESNGVFDALAGKASSSHTHDTYAPKASPTFTGTPTVAASTAYTTTMIRNAVILPKSSEPVDGATSSYPNGTIVFVKKA